MKIITGGVTAAKGFEAASVEARIKYQNRKDMALVYSQVPCVAAGTFTTGINVLYEKCGTKTWAGIYTGLKLSVFVYAALHAYEVTGPYVSIGWLVLSIILIASGFVFRYRYLRMYGMFLTMFAIVKLLVFDISYENGIVRAGSFLVSGLLCFVISMIYNKWSRKMEGEKNGDE